MAMGTHDKTLWKEMIYLKMARIDIKQLSPFQTCCQSTNMPFWSFLRLKRIPSSLWSCFHHKARMHAALPCLCQHSWCPWFFLRRLRSMSFGITCFWDIRRSLCWSLGWWFVFWWLLDSTDNLFWLVIAASPFHSITEKLSEWRFDLSTSIGFGLAKIKPLMSWGPKLGFLRIHSLDS